MVHRGPNFLDGLCEAMAAGDGNGGAFNLNVQFQNEHARTRWFVCLFSLLSLSPAIEHTTSGEARKA